MAWQLPAQINVSVVLCLDLACVNHLALSGSVFKKQSLSQGAKSCQDRLTNFASALLAEMEPCFPTVPLLESALQLEDLWLPSSVGRLRIGNLLAELGSQKRIWKDKLITKRRIANKS